MGELEFFAGVVVYTSLFCVGMGLVAIFYQWATRPPIGVGLVVTVSGVIVLVLLVAQTVYTQKPTEVTVPSLLYFGGLLVTSCGLVLLTVATRAAVTLRDMMSEDEYFRLRTLRKRRDKKQSTGGS